MDIISNLLLILALIIINAFFAGSEAALVAANEIKVKSDVASGNKKAALTLKYIKNPTNFLSTIQVGITFIGFINGFLAAEAFTEPIIMLFNITNSPLANGLVKILITLILTYLQVVFGELFPKKIAINNPEKFIYRTIGILNILNKLMKILILSLTKSANFVSKIFGIKDEKNEMTEEELRMLVIGSGDAIKDSEKEMIRNVLDFDDQFVSEVMTHRTEVFAVDVNLEFDKIIEKIMHEGFSRVPFYQENIDNIIGILHTKDLFAYLISNEKKNINIKSLLRKAYFIPETMKTSKLFKEMQKSKTHMAIVIDEFGGTSGIITIEDLLEEIVGNIFDEYDETIVEIEKINDKLYLIDGLTNIDDVENEINADLPIDEYDTLSGFIIGILGRLPEKGEKISIDYNNFNFEVISYDKRIIRKVKISKLEKVNEDE